MYFCGLLSPPTDGSALVLRTERDKLRITGEPKVWGTTETSSGKETRRYFCGDCGTHIWAESDAYPSVRTVKVSE